MELKKQEKIDKAILFSIFTECAIPTFVKWFNLVYPTIADLRVERKKNICNYSVITFSIHEFPSGEIAKKVAIGTSKERDKDGKVFTEFLYMVRENCPEIFKKFIDIEDKIEFFGVGIECFGGLKEWKFYVGTKDCVIFAATCVGGKLVEEKRYKYDKQRDAMFVAGKVKRLQPNIELVDEKALKFLNWLKRAGYISNHTYTLSKAMLEYLSLDTISSSKERGVSLYFE